nr:FUSC family protein [Dermacoccus sp. Tok2021]
MLFAGGALVAGLVGAVVGSLYGSTHAYWAMVAVFAGLTGATRRARLTRGLHRLIGTFAGVGLAALILPLYPPGRRGGARTHRAPSRGGVVRGS